MAEAIDPAALFISDDGQVRLWPEHAGKYVVKEQHLEAWDWKEKRPLDEPVRIIDRVWYSIKAVPPEQLAAALALLLQQRATLEDLLIEYFWHLYHTPSLGWGAERYELMHKLQDLEFVKENARDEGKRRRP